MPSSCGIRLALLLACALMSIAAQAQPGRRVPAKQPKEFPRQVDSLSVAARREWGERQDWIHFTTRALGDTAVTAPILARYLLSKGADVNARDGDGRTPLMILASAGGYDHFGGFASLSPWGRLWSEPVCDLKGPGERSSVVGGFESWHGQVVAQRPMLRLLLDAGADVTLKDPQGLDALDHAAKAGPTGLDRLLPVKAAAGEPTRCDLGLARSPEVRGLRLGMTLREAASRFSPPRVAEAEWCGRQTLEFDWGRDLLGQPAPRPREFASVRRVRLGFLDGRLAYFRVTYDPGEAPLTPEQFRATLSSSLALPGRWRRADVAVEVAPLYSVSCDGFAVVAGYEVGPYVEVHDTGAIDLLLRRREEGKLRRLREAEEEKERKRRVFKP